MRPFAGATVWTFPILVGVTQCASPIEAPSAFAGEQYLCDAEHLAEYDANIAACRDLYARDRSCAGYVSFRGTIDGQAVVVDAPVARANRQTSTVGTEVTNGMTAWSLAPYFAFGYSFVDLTKPATGELMVFGSSAFDFINLEARGINYLAQWTNETRNVEVITSTEVRFSFSTDLVRGGHIDGCIDVFLPAL